MLEINGLKFPLDRKYYTKNGAHLWLLEEGDVLKVGMDAFGSDMAGLLTFLAVTPGEVGTAEAVGSFESAKFVSRLYSPVKGDVVAINESVINNPRKINDDPYSAWIFSIKPDGPLPSENIISGEDAVKVWIEEEFRKLEE